MRSPRTALALTLAAAGCAVTARSTDAALAAHLGPPEYELHRLFEGGRFPCVVVALDGTVVATWGRERLVARRSVDGGATWGPTITIAEAGIHGGGALVDERSGDVLAFVEAGHPPAAATQYRSRDHGATWTAEPFIARPNSLGHVPSLHMNEAGLTLARGPHAGRLVRPSRWYAAGNAREHWPDHYTNALYSDDGGRTWQASEPFPERGTGEAAIVELADGRLHYNSRVHWPERPHPMRRRRAASHDGGRTWTDWAVVHALPDGRQDRAYGCMGGLARLPLAGCDVLLFSNLDTDAARRERVTVWASFDGGETWPVKRLAYEGPSAYSSLAAGRPGTPSEGQVYLLFEADGGGALARFDLAWVLAGEATGDGAVPGWVSG